MSDRDDRDRSILDRDSRTCTGRYPCIPCALKAERIGWPTPMGETRISFCEQDRIASDGP